MALTASLGLALPVWARNSGVVPWQELGMVSQLSSEEVPSPCTLQVVGSVAPQGFGCLGLVWEAKLGDSSGFLGAGLGPCGAAGCRFRAQPCRE